MSGALAIKQTGVSIQFVPMVGTPFSATLDKISYLMRKPTGTVHKSGLNVNSSQIKKGTCICFGIEGNKLTVSSKAMADVLNDAQVLAESLYNDSRRLASETVVVTEIEQRNWFGFPTRGYVINILSAETAPACAPG